MISAAPAPWIARGGDQLARGGSERRRRRGGAEDEEAGDEHPPPAETVAHDRAGQHEDADAQHISVDRPAQLLDRCVQILPDRCERGDETRLSSPTMKAGTQVSATAAALEDGDAMS
jgi:hypothetical protein